MKHSYKVGQVVSHVEHPELVGVIVQLIVLGIIVNCENSHDPVDMIPYLPHNYENLTEEEYNEPWYRIVWFNENDDTGFGRMDETPTTKYNGQESEGQLVPK